MRVAAYFATALLAAVSAVSAQSVKGKPYGFASGVTGGAGGEVATPKSASELAALLSDNTARCAKEASDAPKVSNLKYDTAALDALKVGSNKSIISSNGKGVLKGKGLSLQSGTKNVIIQGITITDLNPGLFSLIGRIMVVAHYKPSRLTISNTEFNGKTTTSATCNGNHYWTMMFYRDSDRVTLDRNYIHDCSGRAPKLGEDGTTCYVHAVNNVFSNMEGHAFEAYGSANALIEGNSFESVTEPFSKSAQVNTAYTVADDAAATACSSSLGRTCLQNTLTSSGNWPSLGSSSTLSALAKYKDSLITPVAVAEAKSYVLANAGPENLASYKGSD
ncbi:pectin lyase [Diaporthe sp. PMI_573]|nr:pectin lyase [Diaporthaceae sp. PMI_573]